MPQFILATQLELALRLIVAAAWLPASASWGPGLLCTAPAPSKG